MTLPADGTVVPEEFMYRQDALERCQEEVKMLHSLLGRINAAHDLQTEQQV